MKQIAYVGFALALALPIAHAGTDPHAGHAGHGAPAAANAAAMSEGEVKKVDKKAGKVTIKHGPLANLNMPPMTMVFGVKDVALLDGVNAGDKIRFLAEKSGNSLRVSQLERAK